MVGGEGWFDTSSWGDTLNGWKRKATGYASGTDAGYDAQPMPEAAPMPEAVNMPAEAAPGPMPEQYPAQETPMGDMSSVGGRRRRRKSRKGRKGRKHGGAETKDEFLGHPINLPPYRVPAPAPAPAPPRTGRPGRDYPATVTPRGGRRPRKSRKHTAKGKKRKSRGRGRRSRRGRR